MSLPRADTLQGNLYYGARACAVQCVHMLYTCASLACPARWGQGLLAQPCRATWVRRREGRASLLPGRGLPMPRAVALRLRCCTGLLVLHGPGSQHRRQALALTAPPRCPPRLLAVFTPQPNNKVFPPAPYPFQ